MGVHKNNAVKFEILIPTYNRNEQLLKNLDILAACRGFSGINIVIVDNFSERPVAEFLNENGYAFWSNTKVVRNNSNVGLGANLVMCFLNASSEWVWLLGDDDLPLQHCIADIEAEISNSDDADFLIKFNSKAGKFPDRDFNIKTLTELVDCCKDLNFYSNILFISNSVFRLSAILPFLKDMFACTRSVAPHIEGIISNLEKGRKISIINKYLTEHGTPDSKSSWDKHTITSGILFFNILDNQNPERRRLFSTILKSIIASNSFYKPFFIYPFRHKQYPIEYWRIFFKKSSALFQGTKAFYLITLSHAFGFFYQNNLVNKFISRFVNQEETGDMNRS